MLDLLLGLLGATFCLLTIFAVSIRLIPQLFEDKVLALTNTKIAKVVVRVEILVGDERVLPPQVIPLLGCASFFRSGIQDAYLLNDVRNGRLLQQVVVALCPAPLCLVRLYAANLLLLVEEGMHVQAQRLQTVPLHVVLVIFAGLVLPIPVEEVVRHDKLETAKVVHRRDYH